MFSKIEPPSGNVFISPKWEVSSCTQNRSGLNSESKSLNSKNRRSVILGAFNLVLKDLEKNNMNVRIVIPPNAGDGCFNCTILRTVYNQSGVTVESSLHDRMMLSIQQVKKVAFYAIYFEKSSYQNSDSSFTTPPFENEAPMALEKDISLIDGKNYDLIFEAKGIEVTAKLVSSDNQISENDSLPISQQCEDLEKELLESLKSIHDFLYANLVDFRAYLEEAKVDILIECLDICNQRDVVKREIQKMQKDVLKTLVNGIRKLKSEGKVDKLTLERTVAKLFINIISQESLKNIVIANFKSAIKAKVTPQFEMVIEKLADEFLQPYLNHLGM